MPRRVLIGSGDLEFLYAVGPSVQMDGHKIATAYDGVEALKLIESFNPDVAVLDTSISGIDGYEVARRVRSKPNSELLLIALADRHSREDVDRAISAGFNYRLVKPIDVEHLQRILGWPELCNT